MIQLGNRHRDIEKGLIRDIEMGNIPMPQSPNIRSSRTQKRKTCHIRQVKSKIEKRPTGRIRETMKLSHKRIVLKIKSPRLRKPLSLKMKRTGPTKTYGRREKVLKKRQTERKSNGGKGTEDQEKYKRTQKQEHKEYRSRTLSNDENTKRQLRNIEVSQKNTRAVRNMKTALEAVIRKEHQSLELHRELNKSVSEIENHTPTYNQA